MIWVFIIRLIIHKLKEFCSPVTLHSTIGKHWCSWRDTTEENTAAFLKFAKDHMGVPQSFWNNVLWTDDTMILLPRELAVIEGK